MRADINSYISLKSRINYELLYNKVNKFRYKVFLSILNNIFPRVPEYDLDRLERKIIAFNTEHQTSDEIDPKCYTVTFHKV